MVALAGGCGEAPTPKKVCMSIPMTSPEADISAQETILKTIRKELFVTSFTNFSGLKLAVNGPIDQTNAGILGDLRNQWKNKYDIAPAFQPQHSDALGVAVQLNDSQDPNGGGTIAEFAPGTIAYRNIDDLMKHQNSESPTFYDCDSGKPQ